MMNAVSYDPETQVAGGVLIRSLEPVLDVPGMKLRRKKDRLEELTTGPGKLCLALNIVRSDNGVLLSEGNLLIIDAGKKGFRHRLIFPDRHKKRDDLLYRFFINNCPFVSRK